MGWAWKAAREVLIGQCVVEADGFLWRVTGAAAYPGERKIAFKLEPVYQTMLSEQPQVVCVRDSKLVRVVVSA